MSVLKKFMDTAAGKQIGAVALGLGLATMPFAPAANAGNDNISEDYVKNCTVKHMCAEVQGSTWSSQNQNGVGVSIKIGANDSPQTIAQVKSALEGAFTRLGVQTKFFIQQNDAPATGVSLHVRGGTEGPYKLDQRLIAAVSDVAARAKNNDPALAMH